ncbi:ABC transporter ATP-binding protein [Acetobacterium wieringae]|jgi:ABC-2 type transport system ATP-binding protein|uniref:ABC transporter ATP-binding protein n=1 Tax=Acetobacterium wieringae TaxID=52694 RepID=A0A1F2PHJ1_9FIRM|nr:MULTISPECIES: ABC transporter ATP-binding protein [Acetobacterium]HAZ06710.1 ABC transporter ATP-binding protein [Acetobacterium sp.]OFV70783.1 fluoroquinolones export ATP-binding proteinc [Acetobacterium wieringae]OXS26660.1 MAG: ABC transporter [Acetobacterium sp. MES1]TYC83714.1 ABC transporter ATP-binding protein [Acetobacterium wieringae]URN84324.1 ABC transporter ATP-binding protein [Acetobacterium wieringae]
MNLIEAKGLTKKFQDKVVIKGLDMVIGQGEIVALIGPNGVGKSTTIAMLLGILSPDQGSITYWRTDYQQHLAVQLQTTPFFEGYSARENLALFSALYRIRLSEAELQNRLEACQLGDTGNTPAIRLSLGQQKRLALAVTTVHQPTLIVLDEPTAGLDPRASHEIRELIRQMVNNNQTVLFSSHDMEEVETLADRIIFMNNGQIIAEGAPKQLITENGVANLDELYLKLTQTPAVQPIN